MEKTVVFRADAATWIGTGHVTRCLTLADALRSLGVKCQFICRQHEGNLIASIQDHDYPVHVLEGLQGSPAGAAEFDHSDPGYSGWLGATQQEDAIESASIVEALAADCLVVDNYSLDISWESVLRPHVRSLMVIDDLANREHDCDLLLDQNWFAGETQGRYANLIPVNCAALLGPRYALLGPEYALLRRLLPQRDGLIRRVLVFLGGGDPCNHTVKLVESINCEELDYLLVDVVIGSNHADMASITEAVARRPLTRLHQGLPTLSGLMFRADLMIGAGGSTTWERMCLGLPNIVISVAQNQEQTSANLGQAGYTNYLGPASQVGPDDIVTAVRYTLDNAEIMRDQSEKMQELVPGDGASHVARKIVSELCSKG